MDKQTCAALLNMLGFDSYNVNYTEFLEGSYYSIPEFRYIFLLKTKSRTRKVGSVVNNNFDIVKQFNTYDEMVAYARELNEKN